MTIYGLGSYYGSSGDVSEEFFHNNVACVGWGYEDSPSLHEMMYNVKIGDIIYLKSHPANIGLIIKAVGIVTDNTLLDKGDLGSACVTVKWVWKGEEIIGRLDDRYNVRLNTMYEEYNPIVLQMVIEYLTR